MEPSAVFSAACSGLSCEFDGSASVDVDGELEAYEWDFGDGEVGTGVAPVHEYAAPGEYTVSLVVTDDRGGTGSASQVLNVIDPDQIPVVALRDVTSSNSNTNNAQVQIPDTVQVGDVLLLVATLNSASTSVTGPAGWTLLQEASDSTVTATTAAWSRVAVAGDAGSSVSVPLSAYTKTSLQLLAYADAAGVESFTQAFDTESRAERTTPVVEVSVPGSTVVSIWSNKSSVNSSWTIPSGATLRDLSVGTGGGRIVQAVADSGPLGVGPAGGLTATTDSADRRGILWSIVLAPQAGTE